jgi:chromosomal replication initiator protein
MAADIGQPDLEHRIAILRKKQEQDHLELTIPDDVLRFIAEHVRSNVRELEGCIIKLLLFASLKHKEVSIELAREALSDKIRPGEDSNGIPKAMPSINKVQEVVARRCSRAALKARIRRSPCRVRSPCISRASSNAARRIGGRSGARSPTVISVTCRQMSIAPSAARRPRAPGLCASNPRSRGVEWMRGEWRTSPQHGFDRRSGGVPGRYFTCRPHFQSLYYCLFIS